MVTLPDPGLPSRKDIPVEMPESDGPKIASDSLDTYFNRKADESKKILDRIGFPEQLVPKK
jgi:hypothetical protein